MTVFTVADFIAHINDVLSKSWDATELCVEGEVSDFKISQGQWVNFSLKDDKGLVSIFMTVWNLRVPLQDGMKVQVYGTPRIYPKFGKFSISAERVELVGEGALKKALIALQMKLEKEGLFDESRKRQLPEFPSRIALIASGESAAYGDFVRILGERWGGLQIDLYHVKVQGAGSAEDLVRAIKQANTNHKDYDALVMTRGGGSLEDLMSFNDEQVVRAIYASKIPTLVGIGHERDISLAELTADIRGSTPTDCARRLVPDKSDVLRNLAYQTDSIERLLKDRIANYQDVLSRAMRSPGNWISRQKIEMDRKTSLISANMRQLHQALLERYRSQIRLLASLDPKGVLARGYTMLSDARGRAITSTSALKVGTKITAILRDGESDLTVNQIRTKNTAIKQQKLL
ncbi:MAG: exodeoxyribonuclease VII large subunit [Patescibacteria group bacterium]|nr:exodeoxyribonuclease VII large subunit [Patescibacteria group bacterium]